MIIGPADGFTPRPYQAACIDGGDPRRGAGIRPCFARYKSVLAVLATGLGKTEIVLSLARRFIESPKTPADKRVLILAHRDELVSSPIRRSHRFGLRLAREQANDTAVGSTERVIASTIQSMARRYQLYRPDEIGLVIVDEAHHICAEDYLEVVNYFQAGGALLLGVTATPQRLDGIALGEVFEAVAYNYPILDAVDDGWLVPVMVRRHIVEGLDLEKLSTRGGDLEPGKLGELLAEHAHIVAKELVDVAGDRATMVFCPTVPAAYAQAEALRRYTSARVECAFSGTPQKRKKSDQQDLLKGVTTRQDMVDDFRAGKVQYLVNCALYTEGFDAPNTRCIALVRPSESASLYVQMVGRGTRPLPGVVDHPELAGDPAGRRAAIAASAKPDVLVIDFTCNSEKHTLTGVVDALAGNLTPEERLALGKVELVGDKTVDQAVQEARILAAENAARRAEELAELASHSYEVDPFHPVCVFNMKGLRDNPNEKRVSEAMAKYLTRAGVRDAAKLSRSTGTKLQYNIRVREKFRLASLDQSMALQRAGVPASTTVKMKIHEAGALIAELQRNGKRRPPRWDSDPALGGQAPTTR